MNRRILIAASAAFALGLASSGLAQTQPATQTPAPAAVTLIGCVARVPPPPAAGATAQMPAPPAQVTHSLTDVQAGGSSPVVGTTAGGRSTTPPAQTPPKPGMVVEHQYWLKAPASIALAQYENQRVEVVGSISASSAVEPAVRAAGQGTTPVKTRPLSVLTLTTLKVLSTECK